jgi:hypothetical protein
MGSFLFRTKTSLHGPLAHQIADSMMPPRAFTLVVEFTWQRKTDAIFRAIFRYTSDKNHKSSKGN